MPGPRPRFGPRPRLGSGPGPGLGQGLGLATCRGPASWSVASLWVGRPVCLSVGPVRQDSLHKLKKTINRVYTDAAKLTYGLCPDEAQAYMLLMDERAAPMSLATTKLETLNGEFVAGKAALGDTFQLPGLAHGLLHI